MGAGAICRWEAYHTEFPGDILRDEHPICHLEAVNAVVALKTWVPQIQVSPVHLYTEYAKAMAIVQLCRGRDTYTLKLVLTNCCSFVLSGTLHCQVRSLRILPMPSAAGTQLTTLRISSSLSWIGWSHSLN